MEKKNRQFWYLKPIIQTINKILTFGGIVDSSSKYLELAFSLKLFFRICFVEIFFAS